MSLSRSGASARVREGREDDFSGGVDDMTSKIIQGRVRALFSWRLFAGSRLAGRPGKHGPAPPPPRAPPSPPPPPPPPRRWLAVHVLPRGAAADALPPRRHVGTFGDEAALGSGGEVLQVGQPADVREREEVSREVALGPQRPVDDIEGAGTSVTALLHLGLVRRALAPEDRLEDDGQAVRREVGLLDADPLLHPAQGRGVARGELVPRQPRVEVADDGARLVHGEAVILQEGNDSEGLLRQVLGGLLVALRDVHHHEFGHMVLLRERGEHLARAGAHRMTVELHACCLLWGLKQREGSQAPSRPRQPSSPEGWEAHTSSQRLTALTGTTSGWRCRCRSTGRAWRRCWCCGPRCPRTCWTGG